MHVLCGVSSQLLLLLPGLQRRGPVCEQMQGLAVGWRGWAEGRGWTGSAEHPLFANESGRERVGPRRAAPVLALLSMWGGDKCRDYFKEKPIRVVNRPKAGNRAEREARMTAGLPNWWMGWEDICKESRTLMVTRVGTRPCN